MYDIGDQNTKYVFAIRASPMLVYLNLNLHLN